VSKKPNNVPATGTQVQVTSLSNLAKQIRHEHAAVKKAAEDVANHILAAGRALIQAKKAVAHGQWTGWLKQHCEVSEREAQRYMEITRGFDENRHTVSDLVGQSLRGLKLQLAPPKERPSGSTAPATGKQIAVKPTRRATHCDLLGLWAQMPAEERHAFFNGIGLRAIVEGIPKAWLDDAVDQLVERQSNVGLVKEVGQLQPPTDLIPADLSVPACLRRKPEQVH
jgi:Protein of unknown function (DUF3102)